MKGTWIIFIAAAFLLLVLAWLAQETDPGKRYGSKAYHRLLGWFLGVDLTLERMKRYLHLSAVKGFVGYRGNETRAERMVRRQRRLEEFRRETGTDAQYRQRERYNRKVLE